jgi:hypothetical protein
MTSTSTPAPAQPGNELYFTKGTKRFERIGSTLRVVTEGATIEITLGDATAITVTADAGVSVTKRVRKPAARKQAAAKPAAPAAAK